MRSTVHSTPSSKRRALHERTPSETNLQATSSSQPTQSLRLVDDRDDVDVYSANPYPTKPEHVLLPRPGKGQGFFPDSILGVSDAHEFSTGTLSSATSHVADDSAADQSFNDTTWDASTIDAGNSPSQVWEEDPASSRSTFPDTEVPTKPFDKDSDGSEAAFSDDGMIVLPTATPTIKAVVSEPPSPQSVSGECSGPETPGSSNSSPNVVTIGPPSSPNFEALDNSSLNFVRIGNSSSNQGSATRSNSLSSMNSLGTVVRYIGVAPWARSSSSEHSSSRAQSFHSTPPNGPVAPRQSTSSFALATRQRSRSRSATNSSRSGQSASDAQIIIDSGVFIQYPTIRAPSSSSSWVDASNADSSQHESMSDRSSGRWNPHLSTVPSLWSAECESRSASPVVERSDSRLAGPSRPSAALVRQNTTSSVWLVTDSDGGDEGLDNLSNLRSSRLRDTNSGFPHSLSSGSRRSSLRSMKRPGTSSSLNILNVIPAWAKVYYRNDGRVINPGLPVIDSRPMTARPPTAGSNMLSRMPTALSRSSTRPQIARDPRDPRSHWVRGPEPEPGMSGTARNQLRHSWSPHLYPDRCIANYRGSMWGAPSMDSREEPVFGRRNIQVYSFCIGFIFPLAWLIAAFLPLPNKPKLKQEGDGEPDVEATLQMRIFDLEERRYENARWWRYLNRWMSPLGFAIIAVIVTLAVVGTKLGF